MIVKQQSTLNKTIIVNANPRHLCNIDRIFINKVDIFGKRKKSKLKPQISRIYLGWEHVKLYRNKVDGIFGQMVVDCH